MEEVVCRAPPQLFKVDGEFESSTPQGQVSLLHWTACGSLIGFQWNRFQFTFYGHYNVITIHRPYFVAVLLDIKSQELRQAGSPASLHSRYQPPYLKSLDASIRSAEVILDTMEEAISSQYPGMQVRKSIADNRPALTPHQVVANCHMLLYSRRSSTDRTVVQVRSKGWYTGIRGCR